MQKSTAMELGLRWWAALGVVCAAGAMAHFVSACSGGDDSGQPDAQTQDQTVGCQGTLTLCNNVCVDFNSDPGNCGGCSVINGPQHACANSQKCSSGSCVQVCGGGSSLCGDACADLVGDPNNCGSCGKKCDPGSVCNDGGCGLSCQSGFNACPNDAGALICTDPQTNDYNCGGCVGDGGVACAPGTICEGGVCSVTCQAGLSICPFGDAGANACANLIVDPNNCGSCGTVCEGGTFCSPTDDAGDAACGLGCFGGTLLCNNRCVDPKIDPYNCGSCNFVCDGGLPQCVDGGCL